MGRENFHTRMESEAGKVIYDPSEDAIFIGLDELDGQDNMFVTIEPTDESENWYAVVSKHEQDGFEIELRDATTREHRVYTEAEKGKVALDVLLWMVGRPAVARRRAGRE